MVEQHDIPKMGHFINHFNCRCVRDSTFGHHAIWSDIDVYHLAWPFVLFYNLHVESLANGYIVKGFPPQWPRRSSSCVCLHQRWVLVLAALTLQHGEPVCHAEFCCVVVSVGNFSWIPWRPPRIGIPQFFFVDPIVSVWWPFCSTYFKYVVGVCMHYSLEQRGGKSHSSFPLE